MEDYFDPYKWNGCVYEQAYGKESGEKSIGIPRDFLPYQLKIKKYWNEEKAIGILEINGKFVGIVYLVAKEVTDKENFVRKFGLSFEKDAQRYVISSL